MVDIKQFSNKALGKPKVFDVFREKPKKKEVVYQDIDDRYT